MKSWVLDLLGSIRRPCGSSYANLLFLRSEIRASGEGCVLGPGRVSQRGSLTPFQAGLRRNSPHLGSIGGRKLLKILKYFSCIIIL